LNSHWVVYSGGAGGDISFELELVKRSGCEVFLFDPSPSGASTVNALADDPGMKLIHFFLLLSPDGRERSQFLSEGIHDGENWVKAGAGDVAC
jgi:hypothetical protein